MPRFSQLSAALLILLGVELLVLGAGGFWLVERGSWSATLWLAVAATWVLGFPLLITINSFWATRRRPHHPPRPAEHQIGIWGFLRMLLAESWAMTRAYQLWFRFHTHVVGTPCKLLDGRGRTPVILIHGFLCTHGHWMRFARALQADGSGPIFALTLEPVFGSIDRYAEQLKAVVEAVCRETGAAKVALIGHSMGGLVIRAYAHRLDGGARIAAAVTLGSPHHGTKINNQVRALGENLHQMGWQSDWLRALAEFEARPFPAPIASVMTPHDNIVVPQSSAHLDYPNAKNIVLPGLGHMELVVSPQVFRETMKLLREAAI